MEDRKNIQEELREIAPLLQNIEKTNVFSMPVDYFNELPSLILEKTQTLQFQNTKLPYVVPVGYFERFPDTVLQKIDDGKTLQETDSELSTIAPLLSDLPVRKNMYSVPAGYFESLDLAQHVKQAVGGAKVIPIKRRNWYTYASVAIISGLILLGGFTWVKESSYHRQFNKVKNTDMQEAISGVSDADILHFLDKQVAMPEATSTNLEEFHEPDLDEAVNDMTNQEILEYLDNNKEPGEVVVSEI